MAEILFLCNFTDFHLDQNRSFETLEDAILNFTSSQYVTRYFFLPTPFGKGEDSQIIYWDDREGQCEYQVSAANNSFIPSKQCQTQ